MSKKVSIGARPSTRQAPAPPSVDEWVGTRGESAAPPATAGEPTKRLTIDLPESLHRRVKVGCAMEGTNIAAEVRRFLEERFPG